MTFSAHPNRTFLLGALLAASAIAVPTPASAQGHFVVSTGFYDTLSPYGEWLELTGLGTVWRPDPRVVGGDFYPYYSGGYWEYTEYGWTWQSEYAWGWVPFHHGRWMFSEEFGWVWIPGDEWGPAWVEWRVGRGYVGWVPLGLAGVSVFGVATSPRWCWFRENDFWRRDFHRSRLYGDAEQQAFHYAAPVTVPRGERPRGPPPGVAAGVVVTPVTLGPPRALTRGSVSLEDRLALPARPRSIDRRDVAPPPHDFSRPPPRHEDVRRVDPWRPSHNEPPVVRPPPIHGPPLPMPAPEAPPPQKKRVVIPAPPAPPIPAPRGPPRPPHH